MLFGAMEADRYATTFWIRTSSHHRQHKTQTQKNEAQRAQYSATLSELTKRVQKDIQSSNATVASIGGSVLYRLLLFAANYEVRVDRSMHRTDARAPPPLPTRFSASP